MTVMQFEALNIFLFVSADFRRRRYYISGQLMINLCSALMLLYLQALGNDIYVVANGSELSCRVLGILGHWITLAVFIATAGYAVWLYLQLSSVCLHHPPPYYTITVVLATWSKSNYHILYVHTVTVRIRCKVYTYTGNAPGV